MLRNRLAILLAFVLVAALTLLSSAALAEDPTPIELAQQASLLTLSQNIAGFGGGLLFCVGAIYG